MRLLESGDAIGGDESSRGREGHMPPGVISAPAEERAGIAPRLPKQGGDGMALDEAAAARSEEEAAAARSEEEAAAARWEEEEEEAEWDERAHLAAMPTAPSARDALKRLGVQALADLTAAESTHVSLVNHGIMRVLLPLATDGRGGVIAEVVPAQPPTRPPSDPETTLTKPRTDETFDPEASHAAVRKDAIASLANLAENPAVHARAFGGAEGDAALGLFAALVENALPELQREGFRALSALALSCVRAEASSAQQKRGARRERGGGEGGGEGGGKGSGEGRGDGGADGRGGGGLAVAERLDGLIELLVRKASQVALPDAVTHKVDDELAFHGARTLALLSLSPANQRRIFEMQGLRIMATLARLPEADVQAEAAAVIANVTAAIWEAQLQVCEEGILPLLLYLVSSPYKEVQLAAARAIANVSQNFETMSAIRNVRAEEVLCRLYEDVAVVAEVKRQLKRAISNIEGASALVKLRRYGGAEVVRLAEGEIAQICQHADPSNPGAQREVARALANLAASAQNHAPFMAEGAFVLCMDLLVSSSVDVQRQAIRALANLSLTEELSIQERIVDEGMPELLVLLAASWDEGVQLEAAIAIAGFAGQPRNRTALVRAGALPPLVEQLTSADAAVRYHAAIAMGALS